MSFIKALERSKGRCFHQHTGGSGGIILPPTWDVEKLQLCPLGDSAFTELTCESF